jgi:ABC-type bacteriocin/lantibiotic exporter with double-glycine peptidase domain
MLCIKEYKIAGVIPIIVNIACMSIYVAYATFISKCQSYKRQAKARAELSSVTLDCIKNSQTIKYFNKENWSLKRQESTQISTFGKFLAMPANICNVLFYTIMWIPTIIAVYFCWEDKATVLYVIMMSYVIDNIGGYISNFMDYYTEKSNQLDILGKLEPDTTEKSTMPNILEIRDIEFRYDVNNKNGVLFKIDHLDIVRGHRYCVTGKSGFGKSTLAKLLSGTFKPITGNIPDIESVYMFAESEMFNTTIAENIALGDTYDKKEITDILNIFEIDVDLDVFNDSVGENGNLLSTGQRQRINLARTLFYARRHTGSLIVMDEVTAALDINTSITCLEYLTEEFKRLGITLIYISNKTDYQEVDLITDNIYVSRKGKIVTYNTD